MVVRSELRRVEGYPVRLPRSQGETVPVVAFAKAIYAVGAGGADHSSRDTSADPAWDLLLDLDVARVEGLAPVHEHACLGAGAGYHGVQVARQAEEAGVIVAVLRPTISRMIHVALRRRPTIR